MKIAEYQQMMDYLTGPRERFNGGGSVRNKTILPKKKPAEEVKKRKIKNFEKLKGALENPKEVKEMIDKPKRGLVDEPGKYAGAADVRAFLKKAKKGSTIDVTKFIDEFAETQAERNQLSADFKRISKEFKDKNLKFKTGVTGRKPKLEGKTGQIVEALQDLPKGSQIDLVKLTNDLNLGEDGSSLIRKVIAARKELKNKNFKAMTVTDKAVTRVNEFIENYIKTNDKLPTQGEIRTGAKVDATNLRRYIAEGKVQEIAKTAFEQNRLAAEYILNSDKPTLDGLKKIIGDTSIGTSEKQGRNLVRSAESLATRVYINSLRSLTNKLTKTDEGRSVYKNFSANDVENIKNKIRQIPGFNSYYEREITDLVANAYKDQPEKKTKALKKIAKFKKLNETLSEKFKFNQVLDHPLSYDFITKASQGVDPEELIRVRPLPERVNAFKTFLDERVPIITQGLKKNPNNKQFISMRDDVKSVADELKIPFPKISNKGTIVSPAAAKIGDKPIEQDIRKSGQVQNAFRKFVQNISNDPRIQRLGINIDRLKDLSKLPKVNLQAYDKAVSNFLKKSGKFGFIAAAPFLAATKGSEIVNTISNSIFPSLEAAEVPPGEVQAAIPKPKEPMNFDLDMSLPTPKKDIDSGSSLFDKTVYGALPLTLTKGLRRFLTSKYLPAAFSPTALGAYTVDQGGYDLSKPMDRVSLGAEAAFAPSLVKGTLSATKGIKNKALRRITQQALNLGLPARLAMRAARIASPIGIASLVGEGLYGYGKFVKSELDRIKAMTPEEREAYNVEQQEQMSVSAAGGGLLKQAGDRSGKPPEAGPTPQGLDFLIKRGR